jgi:hypothetical protein
MSANLPATFFSSRNHKASNIRPPLFGSYLLGQSQILFHLDNPEPGTYQVIATVKTVSTVNPFRFGPGRE